MNKIHKTLFVIVPTIIMLTGCSQPNNTSNNNTPDESEIEFIISEGRNTDIEPEQSTKIDNGKIIYTSMGSSTCPPIIDKVTKTGNNEYTLSVKNYTKAKCTFDLRPVQQTIERNDGNQIANDASIVLEQPSNKITKKRIL